MDVEPGAPALVTEGSRLGAASTTLVPLRSAPETAGSKPAPAFSERAARRRVLVGTAFFKLGMEAVLIGVPQLALLETGSATVGAALAVASSLAQAIGGTAAGSLLKRIPPQKLLAGAIAMQAVFVSGMLLGYNTLGFNPWLIFPLHALAGLAVGAADTSRKMLPPSILGEDEERIKAFNAKVHISYEFAGVAGALAIGVLLKVFDPWVAIASLPFMNAAAAWSFKGVALRDAAPPSRPAPTTAPRVAGPRGLLSSIRQLWSRAWQTARETLAEMRAAAGAIRREPAFRLAFVAVVLPLVVHRLLENILLPVFAKKGLGDPAAQGWLQGASNFGELAGALALLLLSRLKLGRSFTWLRWFVPTLLIFWAVRLDSSMGLMITVIALQSAVWTMSDLSLTSMFQSKLPKERKGAAIGLLSAAALLITTAASLAGGALFDAYGVRTGLIVFAAAMSALILPLGWVAWRSRKHDSQPVDPDL